MSICEEAEQSRAIGQRKSDREKSSDGANKEKEKREQTKTKGRKEQEKSKKKGVRERWVTGIAGGGAQKMRYTERLVGGKSSSTQLTSFLPESITSPVRNQRGIFRFSMTYMVACFVPIELCLILFD